MDAANFNDTENYGHNSRLVNYTLQSDSEGKEQLR